MTDDLRHNINLVTPGLNFWGDQNDAAKSVVDRTKWVMRTAVDRIEQLEAALRNIAEGDIPRTVKIPFRDDGQSSKHDRCEHGQWFYEDCGCCIEDYARKALEELSAP